jgi:hypothetical protein
MMNSDFKGIIFTLKNIYYNLGNKMINPNFHYSFISSTFIFISFKQKKKNFL